MLEWYGKGHRDLPWRATSDPYRIWVSEIMLQQTRAAAAIPYYEKFLRRFPTVESLAGAPEAEVLACWSGLGYYSRARNLRKAAADIVRLGRFPENLAAIRALPGVGPYTAAAIASIAFGHPHAVLDGNVYRVIARVTNDAADIGAPATRRRFQEAADRLLDRRNPGPFNQAMMELGATVCVPRAPLCTVCPVLRFCQARRAGTQNQLPVKLRGGAPEKVGCALALIERRGKLLLRRRAPGSSRMANFWELPAIEDLPDFQPGALLGTFRHTIVRQRYTIVVYSGSTGYKLRGFRWMDRAGLENIPVTTITRKALAIAGRG